MTSNENKPQCIFLFVSDVDSVHKWGTHFNDENLKNFEGDAKFGSVKSVGKKGEQKFVLIFCIKDETISQKHMTSRVNSVLSKITIKTAGLVAQSEFDETILNTLKSIFGSVGCEVSVEPIQKKRSSKKVEPEVEPGDEPTQKKRSSKKNVVEPEVEPGDEPTQKKRSSKKNVVEVEVEPEVEPTQKKRSSKKNVVEVEVEPEVEPEPTQKKRSSKKVVAEVTIEPEPEVEHESDENTETLVANEEQTISECNHSEYDYYKWVYEKLLTCGVFDESVVRDRYDLFISRKQKIDTARAISSEFYDAKTNSNSDDENPSIQPVNVPTQPKVSDSKKSKAKSISPEKSIKTKVENDPKPKNSGKQRKNLGDSSDDENSSESDNGNSSPESPNSESESDSETNWKSTTLEDYLIMNSDEIGYQELFDDLFDENIIEDLSSKLAKESKQYEIYPKLPEVFNAFKLCPEEDASVLLLGQDPYPDGAAMGLSFSHHPDRQKIQPSLRNIYACMKYDGFKSNPKSGDLSSWAKQGVLLLNTSLTVRQGVAGSHTKKGTGSEGIWDAFTNAVLRYLNSNKEHLVVILWGQDAQKYKNIFNKEKHLILESHHPVAGRYSPEKGDEYIQSKPFSSANAQLKKWGLKQIDWNLA